jgi:tripartite-type tricarboxylate transporter receptor subunit TctC
MDAMRWLVALLLIAGAAVATADTYPSKPVRLVVPYPPGGVVDLFARLLADKLPKKLHQPIVVDNRPGAGGTIGTAAAAAAAPDGYTVLIGASSQIVFEPLLNPTVSYDVERDLVPVAAIARTPFFLVIDSKLGPRTITEFVTLVRSKPGAFTYASGGVGTSSNAIGELFKRAAQVDITHVPYKGDGQGFSDLLGGHVTAQFITFPVIAEMLRSGRVRALLQTGERRVPAAPDVPTAAEAGYPEVTAYGWSGAFVPANTPPAVVYRLNAAITQSIREPDLRKRLEDAGSELAFGSSQQFSEFVRSERAKWKKRINDIGLRVQ